LGAAVFRGHPSQKLRIEEKSDRALDPVLCGEPGTGEQKLRCKFYSAERKRGYFSLRISEIAISAEGSKGSGIPERGGRGVRGAGSRGDCVVN